MKLYLVRHGETALNEKGCYYGKTDAVLSVRGIEQAKYLQHIFKEVSFDYVVASPLVRAYNTAQIIIEERKQQIFGDSRLMDRILVFLKVLLIRNLKENIQQELEQWNKEFSTYRIPEGESFLDVRRRVEAFLKDIPSGEENKSEKMLITAHKGTLGHLLAAMLKLPTEGYWNFVFVRDVTVKWIYETVTRLYGN